VTQTTIFQPARPTTGPTLTHTAAEIAEDAVVRFRGDRPRHGWRGAVYSATGGWVNPGLGAAETARQQWLARIRRPLHGVHRVAVTSVKGGVGKTTVAAGLGLVLAECRGDRIIAIDANPNAGTLADRLTADTTVTLRELLRNFEHTHSLTDVAHFTSLAGRLHVLASEQDPAMSALLQRDEYEKVSALLARYYNVTITDSGTGLIHSAMEGTLAVADSLVVVGAPTVDGASRASLTLDWLDAQGHAATAADAVVVLSCDRMSKDVDVARVREHFAARCRAVVEIPFDPHLATGGRIRLDRLGRATRDAFLQVAAHVADGFDPGRVPSAPAASGQVPALS
jgi:MinD-like ATPase involved in chromosome partitioning or flagellar assembly